MLLATTCLTIASGTAATATTITEGTSPAPSDFSNTAPGYALPVGTDVVFGAVNSSSDHDWFQFQGLAPGSTYQLTAVFNPALAETGLSVAIYNSSQTLLQDQTLEYFISRSALTGTVPTDGVLDVQLFSHSSGSGGYQVSLDAMTATPEPLTLTTAGLALAGALAWRRKRRQ